MVHCVSDPRSVKDHAKPGIEGDVVNEEIRGRGQNEHIIVRQAIQPVVDVTRLVVFTLFRMINERPGLYPTRRFQVCYLAFDLEISCDM